MNLTARRRGRSGITEAPGCGHRTSETSTKRGTPPITRHRGIDQRRDQQPDRADRGQREDDHLEKSKGTCPTLFGTANDGGLESAVEYGNMTRLARFGERCGGEPVLAGGLIGARRSWSAQREGTRPAGGAGERGMRSAFFRGLLFVVVFELGHMSGDIVRRGPAHHQVAPHFWRAFRRLAARPE